MLRDTIERQIEPRNRTLLLWAIAAVILLGVVSVVLISSLTGRLPLSRLNSSTVSHSVVVERVQKVAKLVSTETTLRDVVIYENTWYGSTKRSLVVVTGKVLAGIDLDQGTSVQIDEAAKRITIALPQPGILGIEITDLKTYDEQRGLWNPFSPTDRDVVFQQAREQLEKTSRELKITETAQQSAKELLQDMFGANGYSVEVAYR
jgi:uncharacterized protein DUF4230